jgi:hypothetical protein
MLRKSGLWRARISRFCIARVPQKLDTQLKRGAVDHNSIREEKLDAIIPASGGLLVTLKQAPKVADQHLV